jgi:hypothetical protein
MSCALCSFRPPFLLTIGLRPSPLPPTSSIVCPPSRLLTPTPYFALFGTHPSYDHLHVFGCTCYPNLSSTTPHKLAPRSTRCVFLGYSSDHKGYRCLDLTSHRVLISRHVVFDKLNFPFSSSSSTSSLTELGVFLDPAPVSPTVDPSLQVRSPRLPARPQRPLCRLARPHRCHPPPHSHVQPHRRLLRRHVWPRRPLRRLARPHRCHPPA